MRISTADAPYFHHRGAATHTFTQQGAQALRRQAPLTFQCALPDYHHAPAISDQTVNCTPIAGHVRQNLCSPPISSGCRQLKKGTIMPVPEAPMDKNCNIPFWQDDVGRAWQLSCIQTIPKACAMQETPDDQLWARADRPDSRHSQASLFWSKNIGHSEPLSFKTLKCWLTSVVRPPNSNVAN